MSAAPEVINPQNVVQCWKGMPLDRKDGGKGSTPARLTSGDASSSGDEFNTKVRKPYTITKQRERWTESEHQKFLEALKLYGRAWRRIEEYVGTKTAVQIRSHAQKFFSKLEREASTGSSAGKTQDIEIPPPRPKRKPSHPYPKKAGNCLLNLEDENKESSLPSAGMAAVHHEDFQSGSFNPLVSKRLGSAFHQSPFVPGHFFGSKGSMKLFGKTVVVPKPHKPASQMDASSDNLVDEEISSLDIQTNKSDLKESGGFSSFLKVRKNIEKFSEASLQVDRNGSEGTCVSLARSCRDDLAGTDEPEAADAQFLGKGREQQHRSRVDASFRKNEKTFPPPQKDGEKVDAQFPHGVQQNNIMHQWIDNFFHYNSGLSLPPMATHGLGDGVPADPLTYWQCMQASAVNYAAYTAAMAAAVAAGWTGSIAGGRESTEALPANIGEAQVSLSFGNELCPKALSSAASCCWWPFRGFIPPGPCPPPSGALHPGEDQDISANAKPPGYAKRNGTLDGTDLEMAGEEEASEPFSKVDIEDDEQNNTAISPSAKSGCVLGTSCVTEAPGSESDLKCQHEVDAEVMLMKCATQGSDTERTAATESPQNLYSSSDEFEGQGKKPGEGSSSGSNTPASRFQSSEFEAPTMMQSKKRNCYTLLEDNDDTYSDGFKISHQQCVGSTVESPKFRLKHAEKGKKHQQKDFRHSCSDDSKRLKSSAHELELRKEVSHEGRKAFQALFTSKLLPQSFPAANMADHRDLSFREEHISRPTVSKNEPGLSNVSEPIESGSDECVNTGGSPQGKIYGDDHSSGNNSSGIGANLEMGIGYSALDSQHEVDSKNFTVSLSSGFVPYRRPPCLEPTILDQPSSL